MGLRRDRVGPPAGQRGAGIKGTRYYVAIPARWHHPEGASTPGMVNRNRVPPSPIKSGQSAKQISEVTRYTRRFVRINKRHKLQIARKMRGGREIATDVSNQPLCDFIWWKSPVSSLELIAAKRQTAK